MTVIVEFLLFGVGVSAVRTDWNSVNYRFRDQESNTVQGPDHSFTSVRPESGLWTASFGLSNHFANLKDETILVHSANAVTFQDYNAASGNAGMSSHLCFHIRPSEPIRSAAWDITPGAVLAAHYSADGKKWTDAHVYPPGFGTNHDPPPVSLSFDPPTQSLYVAWFAEVPQGQTGWWDLGGTGLLTFTPARQPGPQTQATQPATPASAPVEERLHGPRRVPESFFGTTAHVNSEGAIKLLKDLNIPNVHRTA